MLKQIFFFFFFFFDHFFPEGFFLQSTFSVALSICLVFFCSKLACDIYIYVGTLQTIDGESVYFAASRTSGEIQHYSGDFTLHSRFGSKYLRCFPTICGPKNVKNQPKYCITNKEIHVSRLSWFWGQMEYCICTTLGFYLCLTNQIYFLHLYPHFADSCL